MCISSASACIHLRVKEFKRAFEREIKVISDLEVEVKVQSQTDLSDDVTASERGRVILH